MGDRPLELQLLGGFVASCGDREVPAGAWRLRKAAAIVKILALAPGRAVHRDVLLESLWPDLSPAAMRNNLNQALHAARRALAATGTTAGIVSRGALVVLDGPVRSDVDAFRALAAAALDERPDGDAEAAARAYAGDLLPEDRFDAWCASPREELRGLAVALWTRVAEGRRAAGDRLAEAHALRQVLALDPFAETTHRALMSALAAAGHRVEALEHFGRLRSLLDDELAAAPEPATHALYVELLAPTAPAPTPRRGEPAAPLSSILGREHELDALDDLLAGARLVTLTGPGGSGKTRLAQETAVRAAPELVGGAWFVPLAALERDDQVADTVARHVGADPGPREDPVDALARTLGAAEHLVVLDNCEHVVDAAAALVLALLPRAPGLRILATSREPLRVAGEHVLPVPPLPLPSDREPRAVAASPAAQLFAQRAAQRAPGFEVTPANAADVARVCRAVDGLPLGLELAAAGVRALPTARIAERLEASLEPVGPAPRSGPSRHATMRATLDWSHALLSAGEQLVLRRMGVTAGGADADLVAALVAGEAIDTDGCLARLVECSLVQADPVGGSARYRLLELTRRYALERLAAAGEHAAARRRHRHAMLALVERLDPASATARPAAFARLEEDLPNLRAALTSGVEDDPADALRLAAALWPFWLERGRFHEGRDWLDRTLDACPGPSPARAEALLGATAILTRTGDFARRAELARERIEVLRAIGDDAGVARATADAGLTAWSQSDHPAAAAAFASAAELAAATDDPTARACLAHGRALLDGARGALTASAAGFRETRALLERCGAGRFLPAAAFCLTVADEPWAPGRRLFFEDTMMVARRLDAAGAEVFALVNLAHVQRMAGELDDAHASVTAAVAAARAAGDGADLGVALVELGCVARARADIPAGRAALEEAVATRAALGDRRGVAMARLALGLLEAAAGEAAAAHLHLDAAHGTFTALGDPIGAAGADLDRAQAARARGDREAERRSLRASLVPCAERRLLRMTSWTRAQLAECELARGDAAAAAVLVADARNEFATLGDDRGLTLCTALDAANGVQIAAP